MKKLTRNILLIVGCLVLMIVGTMGYGMYRIVRFLSAAGADRDIPTVLKQPRVERGREFLERYQFFKLEESDYLKVVRRSSEITDEKERQRYSHAAVSSRFFGFSDLKVFGDEIVAAAKFGGFVFDLQGNLKKQITFEPATLEVKVGPYETRTSQPSFDNLRIFKLDQNRIGYLAYDSVSGARIFNSDGNEIWSNGKEVVDIGNLGRENDAEYEKSTHVLSATAGDLNGDGAAEYVVARKNDGIRVYDQSGSEVWARADEFPSRQLAIFDVDSDGKGELIEVGKAINDGSGKLVREMKGSRGDAFFFVEGKDHNFETRFADIYDGKISYSGENNKPIFTSDAPLSEVKVDKPDGEGSANDESEVQDTEFVSFPKAVAVKLRKDQPPYIAVVASFLGIPRANFYVFDQSGTLVYHELLPERAETIAVAPAGAVEQIFVGGKQTIWRYAVR